MQKKMVPLPSLRLCARMNENAQKKELKKDWRWNVRKRRETGKSKKSCSYSMRCSWLCGRVITRANYCLCRDWLTGCRGRSPGQVVYSAGAAAAMCFCTAPRARLDRQLRVYLCYINSFDLRTSFRENERKSWNERRGGVGVSLTAAAHIFCQMPDRPFHNFGSSKSVDRRIVCTS